MISGASNRIGVTMREVEESNYQETRDALSREWIEFLSRVLPDTLWMPIPNSGKSAVRTAQNWNLDGLIITGGDDFGVSPLRDETEESLLSWALKEGFPVLGICRGMQLLHVHFGGALDLVDTEVHIAKRHIVEWVDSPVNLRKTSNVNSYHKMGISELPIRSPLKELAKGPCGFIESAYSNEPRLLGLMWHPEREEVLQKHDVLLIRWLFGHEGVTWKG